MTLHGNGFLDLGLPRCRFGAENTGFNVVPASRLSDTAMQCISPRADRLVCDGPVEGVRRGTDPATSDLSVRVCLMLNGVDCIAPGTTGDRVFTYIQ